MGSGSSFVLFVAGFSFNMFRKTSFFAFLPKRVSGMRSLHLLLVLPGAACQLLLPMHRMHGELPFLPREVQECCCAKCKSLCNPCMNCCMKFCGPCIKCKTCCCAKCSSLCAPCINCTICNPCISCKDCCIAKCGACVTGCLSCPAAFCGAVCGPCAKCKECCTVKCQALCSPCMNCCTTVCGPCISCKNKCCKRRPPSGCRCICPNTTCGLGCAMPSCGICPCKMDEEERKWWKTLKEQDTGRIWAYPLPPCLPTSLPCSFPCGKAKKEESKDAKEDKL